MMTGYGKARISSIALAVALGVVSAIWVLLFILAATFYGYGTQMVEMWASMHPGVAVTVGGSIVGAIWGFVEGFVFGLVTGWIYNLCLCCCSRHCCSCGSANCGCNKSVCDTTNKV